MQFADGTYDDQMLRVMIRALDDACLQLHAEGAVSPSDLDRRNMIDCIVAAVDGGERDPERLRQIAVGAVSRVP